MLLPILAALIKAGGIAANVEYFGYNKSVEQ